MLIRAFAILLAFYIQCSEATLAPTRFESTLIKHQKLIPFKAKFSQLKTVKEMGLELPSKGELEVKSLAEAIWIVKEPAFLKVEMSSGELKIYSDTKAPPQIIKKQSAASSHDGSWISLLAQSPSEVIKNFNVSELKAYRFKITPKTKKQGFDFLEIQFSDKAALLEIYIQENSEDSLSIKLSGMHK